MITFTPLASSSSGNCYTVSDGETTLLLDCGLSWRKAREALNFRTSEIAGVCLTHSHLDHSKGAEAAARAGLDIYASRETLDALSVPEHRRNVVEDNQRFDIGTWAGLPFKAVHDKEGAFGYYMVTRTGEGFLYLTDSAYAPVRFASLNVIAIECNFVSEVLSRNVVSGDVNGFVAHRTRRTHFSLDTVIEFLRANDLSHCRAVWLLHLSNTNSSEEIMRRRVQEETGIPVYVAGERGNWV